MPLENVTSAGETFTIHDFSCGFSVALEQVASARLKLTHDRVLEVPRERLPELSAYAGIRAVVFHASAGDIQVTAQDEPEIALTFGRECPQPHGIACGQVEIPLEHLQPDARGLSVSTPHCVRDETIPVARASEASLELYGYVPPGWVPHWGIGLSLAGPSLMAGVEAQYMPVRWLAFEAGIVPLAPGAAGAWAATRIRGPATRGVRGFVGGFASTIAALGSSTEKTSESAPRTGSRTFSAVGPRLGIDVSFPAELWMLTIEGDLVHPLGDPELYGISFSWTPFAGLTLSRMY